MPSTRSTVFVITRYCICSLATPESRPACKPASLPAKVMHEISSPELLMALYELHDTREQNNNNDLIYDTILLW